jgi:hypothetical protein
MSRLPTKAEGIAYRQQALYNLRRNSQAQGTHNERILQHPAPCSLQDPVESEGEEEEGDEVQCLIRLFVGWEGVVCWGKAGGCRDKDQAHEGSYSELAYRSSCIEATSIWVRHFRVVHAVKVPAYAMDLAAMDAARQLTRTKTVPTSKRFPDPHIECFQTML